MPKGNIGQCDTNCAAAITAFIRANYLNANSPGSSQFDAPLPAASALRKIKNTLTGLAPTDAELAKGSTPEALNELIQSWMNTPEFDEKMLFYFANTFQQSSLSVEDFQNQLRNRPGAFNLPYNIYGDNAFPMLFKNMKESFARTALHFVKEGRSFADVLTTDEHMMTTALKSLYMQIEANNDTASNSNVMKWRYNYGRRPALADTLNPASPDYMVFGYEAPSTITAGRKFTDNCNGDTSLEAQFPGNVYLFHVLLGSVDRDTGDGPGMSDTPCWERATKPYFTPEDLSDWKLVKIVRGTRIEPWELIKLRASGNSLPSVASRIGFFTTPAFMAVWNTNDSNSHRVTVNQALLVALGQGFTSAEQSIPVPPNTAAVDGAHAVSTSECYACHKSLDPMRQFFKNGYNDNDKPKTGTGSGAQPSFGFGNVSGNGRSLVEFGQFIKQVTDDAVPGDTINRFALEMTQKLCYFANSARCIETDPEMRRIAKAFEASNFNYKQLVVSLFSSPLVTASASTQTTASNGISISITRRQQLCQALSNRLKVPDLCQIALPLLEDKSSIGRLAGSLPADAFSRGVAEPVTASDPTIFYRAAGELLCEAAAGLVVDGSQYKVFSSSNVPAALEEMVSSLMALPPSEPKHARALAILKAHHAAAVAAGANAANALRSTFTAACLAPSSTGLGI
ncbi:MAG: hypothetical protein RL497_1323 [Pseudomonadota bacterium]|jgi:hypothetical protein